MGNIKLAILSCFRLINNKQKESIQKDLELNKEVRDKVMNEVMTNSIIQVQHDPVQSDRMHLTMLIGEINNARATVALNNNIDENDPASMLDVMDFDHENARSKAQTTDTMARIAGNLDGPLGPRSCSINTWLEASNYLVARNSLLTNKLKNKFRDELEIEKAMHRSSLIDDYADVSLEQPSYMDPDD